MSNLSKLVIEHEDTNWFMKHLDSEQEEIASVLAHQVENSEAENAQLRANINLLREAARLVESRVGCGDHSCRFKTPKGMATNGGCRCIDRGSGKPGVVGALAALYRAVSDALENMESK